MGNPPGWPPSSEVPRAFHLVAVEGMGLPGPPWAACPVSALVVIIAIETVTLVGH